MSRLGGAESDIELQVARGGTGRANAGNRQIWIGAPAMWPSTTSGVDALTRLELPTQKLDLQVYDFHPSMDQYAEFGLQMPDNWDGGAISYSLDWTAASGSGNVNWGLEARSFGDNESLEGNVGSGVGVIDALGGNYNLMSTPVGAGLVPGGTPGAGEYVQFRLWRRASQAADSLNSHARLLGLMLEYTASGYST